MMLVHLVTLIPFCVVYEKVVVGAIVSMYTTRVCTVSLFPAQSNVYQEIVYVPSVMFASVNVQLGLYQATCATDQLPLEWAALPLDRAFEALLDAGLDFGIMLFIIFLEFLDRCKHDLGGIGASPSIFLGFGTGEQAFRLAAVGVLGG